MLRFVGIVIVVILLVVVAFWVLGRGGGDEVKYVVTFLGRSQGVEKDIRIVYPHNFMYLFVNGKENKIISVIPITSQGIIKLSGDVVGSNTLENKQQVSDLTWSSSIEESSKYIKYLVSEGFVKELEVYTPQYAEFFMSGGGLVKRVIVFNNYIMVGVLGEGVEIPSLDKIIEEYLR